jgi:hypothetical protein
VYQNGKIPGFFRFKSPLGNYQTPENQDIVSKPCRWFDKIEGLLIHPPFQNPSNAYKFQLARWCKASKAYSHP